MEGCLGIRYKAATFGQYQPHDRSETDIAPLKASSIRLGSNSFLGVAKLCIMT